MAIRRVLHELEAKLGPADPGAGAPGKGKLEYKHYGDDRQRMKIKCRHLGLPDGSRLELRSGDRVIAFLEVCAGRADLDEERDIGAEAPPLAARDVVTLYHDGVPLLSGALYVD